MSDESEKDLAIRLTKEYGVATIPVSAFYKSGKDDKALRFCFSKKESTLEEAVNRLTKMNFNYTHSPKRCGNEFTTGA